MHPLHHWLGATRLQRRRAIRDLFAEDWSPKHDYAELVKIPGHWGVFASLGPHYHYAIFGRDSIETAEDLLLTHRDLVHDIIITLCHLQGTKTHRMSEEEPGKIHHEHRALHLNGFTIPEHSQQIMYELQRVWGGQGSSEMTYYGSHDATPLFIRLVGWYVACYGDSILSEAFHNRDGRLSTVRDSLLAALEWLVSKIMDHPLGLLGYKRLNPDGTANQVWKDSSTSHIHCDGTLPNYDGYVVSVELQGYAYDALWTGTNLGIGTKKLQKLWQDLALHIQRQTLVTLWMEDEQYFAQGLDFDDHRQPRQIATITSDAAALLDSQLIHDLPVTHANHYVQAIAHTVFKPDMLTTAGVRSRSTRHWDLLDFIDYHGPNTVWPKDTFDISKGFRRAGMPYLAIELEKRTAKSLQIAGEFWEFFYVSRDGKVWYSRPGMVKHFGSESPGHYIDLPEAGQAWTIAAAIRIASSESIRTAPADQPSKLEQEILLDIS